MEDVFVLNKQFRAVALFDTFESLLWVERYCEYGDFEIYTPVTQDSLTYLQIGFYLWRKILRR